MPDYLVHRVGGLRDAALGKILEVIFYEMVVSNNCQNIIVKSTTLV